VYVACSTNCFARQPLDRALQIIGELEFTKVEIGIDEQGPFKPSQIVADPTTAAQRIRIGPGLTPAAFDVRLDARTDTEFQRQLRAICRLARVALVPLITLTSAHTAATLDAEVERLRPLVRLADSDGIILCVGTHIGTITENPDAAVALCERVPGLGLTLDPSHCIAGPLQGKSYDQVFPFVHHVHLRDTGRGPNQLQLRVGQGEIEYGRIVSQLARYHYERLLSIDIHDVADATFAMDAEVRKLKYLLESLV
jgi:sugar phosphate isomerase/epimerase